MQTVPSRSNTMSSYDRLATRVTGLAIILGPLLLIVAALAFAFEIGINDGGNESYVEGNFLSYAILCFAPIFMVLGKILGDHSPRLAIFCVVIGTLSVMGGITAGVARIFEGILLDSGGVLDKDINTTTNVAEIMPIAITAIFFPLTHILFGIGLLRSKGVSTLSAGLLIFGGVAFLLAQAAYVATEVTYPLAGIAWLIALVPLGIEHLQLNPSYREKPL